LAHTEMEGQNRKSRTRKGRTRKMSRADNIQTKKSEGFRLRVVGSDGLKVHSTSAGRIEERTGARGKDPRVMMQGEANCVSRDRREVRSRAGRTGEGRNWSQRLQKTDGYERRSSGGRG